MPFTVSHGLLQHIPAKFIPCCAGVTGMLEWIFISNIFAHVVVMSALICDSYCEFKVWTHWIGRGR